MKASTSTLTALVAVATMIVGAVLLVRATDSPRRPPREERPVEVTPPPPAPAAFTGASPAQLPVASAPPAPAPPPSEGPEPLSPLLDDSWRQVKQVVGGRDLGTMSTPVAILMNAAQRDLQPCFGPPGSAPRPGPRKTGPPENPDANDWEPVVLMLHLQALDRELVVVDTTVESLGSWSAEKADCFRDVLRGYRVPAAKVVSGERVRMKYRVF